MIWWNWTRRKQTRILHGYNILPKNFLWEKFLITLFCEAFRHQRLKFSSSYESEALFHGYVLPDYCHQFSKCPEKELHFYHAISLQDTRFGASNVRHLLSIHYRFFQAFLYLIWDTFILNRFAKCKMKFLLLSINNFQVHNWFQRVSTDSTVKH